MPRQIYAFAAAGLLSLLPTAPATAAPLADGDFLPVVNGVTWGDFYADEYGDGFNINDTATSANSDAWDGIGYFKWLDIENSSWSDYLACSNGDISLAEDGSSDYVLTCDSQLDVFSGVNSEISGRLYADGDLLRLEYTITNDTESPFEFGWYSENTYGEGVDQDSEATDLARGFDIQKYGGTGYDQGVAFGLTGAASYPDSTTAIDIGDDFANIYGPDANNLVLGGGESATIVIFYFHQMAGSTNGYDSNGYPSLADWASDWFSGWPNERLARGIDSDVFVANWMSERPVVDPSDDTNEESLAATGWSNVTSTLALSLATIAAGLIARITRRRDV